MNKVFSFMFLMIIFSFVFIGCGSGTAEGPKEDKKTTSLSDTPLQSPEETSSFIDHSLLIDANDYNSQSNNLLIKVYRENNETLYLGTVSRTDPFERDVTLPASDTRVLYQIFPADTNDTIYFGEIKL